MTLPPTPSPAVDPVVDPAGADPTRPADAVAPERVPYMAAVMELAKIRLTGLVVVTTGIGFLLATGSQQVIDFRALVATMIGTTLVAAAASTLNQVWEIPFDRRMERTRHRPLVTGRIGLGGAMMIATVSGGLGLWVLLEETNRLAAGLALATLLSYVLVYTPLKRKVTANTLVGAVPGALPTLIGWAGATGELTGGSWTLFAILFLWQIPHFLAIAWMYREDYARGGFRMLSVADPSGRRSGAMAMLYALALLPVSLTPGLFGITGWLSMVIAPILGALFLIPTWRFSRNPCYATARQLFLASLIYLPLLFGLLLCDPSAPLVTPGRWLVG